MSNSRFSCHGYGDSIYLSKKRSDILLLLPEIVITGKRGNVILTVFFRPLPLGLEGPKWQGCFDKLNCAGAQKGQNKGW